MGRGKWGGSFAGGGASSAATKLRLQRWPSRSVMPLAMEGCSIKSASGLQALVLLLALWRATLLGMALGVLRVAQVRA